jgi:hypothetical protein
MKDVKIGVITLLLFAMVIALTGIGCADPGVNATPETQTISTVTSGDIVGLAMETDAATWTLSGGNRIYTYWGSWDDPAALNGYEDAQYTTAYDAGIVAQAGHTAFTKTMNIDTRNKVTSQSNIKAQTGLTFAATDGGGNVVGSENLMLDGVGDNVLASDRMLCPFVSGTDAYIPSFCNIVQAGGKYDLTIGSVTTGANERFVGTDSTDPVVMNYAINVKPYGTSQGQIPASGSSMAYIKAHTQEARDCFNCKASDLVYSETASAQGTMNAFNKEMSYSSQVAGPLPTYRPL